MKNRLFILGVGLGLAILGGCNDELSEVGSSIQPDGDKSFVYVDSFQLSAKTVLMDSVYARTTSGLLGEIYDPLYGNIKSDYLCQFYCPENYQFQNTPLNGVIDSMDLRIFYSSWVGDSLTPMQVTVYPITTVPERNFYTNVDPEKYCDMQTVLGQKMYTAYDVTISDSVRNGLTSTTYTPVVRVKLPTEIGQDFYNETVNNPGSFENQDAFNQYFPGLYITNTFGSGNLLTVYQTSFFIYYRYTVEGSAGQDSIVNGREQFNVTREVIQLNHVANANLEPLLLPDEKYTYMRTPAGVYTELTLPITEIKETVGSRFLNNLPLTLHAMPQENWDYAFEPPSYLLLLPTDSVKGFFEQNKVENNETAFLSGIYDSSTRTYTFGNISNLIKYQLENAPDEDLQVSVIPVSRETQSDSYSGTEYTVTLSNYMLPSGVKIVKDNDYMKVGLTTSEYNSDR